MGCSLPGSPLVFFRQEYWSGLPCASPGDLPHPGMETMSLMSPTLSGSFFTSSATCEVSVYLSLTLLEIVQLSNLSSSAFLIGVFGVFVFNVIIDMIGV